MANAPVRDSVPHHKLGGFLCAVLAAPSSPQPCPAQTLAPGTRCFIFGEGSVVGFRTQDGVVLSPVVAYRPPMLDCVKGDVSDQQREESDPSDGQCGVSPQCSGHVESDNAVGSPKSAGKKLSLRKSKSIGLVKGSLSVIHQLHALVTHKCLNIIARLLRAAVSESGETRVVVLVDVYLPLAVWSGWQFPQSRSIAGSLFSHLSCDWVERSAMLSIEEYNNGANGDNKSIWDVSDCHVFSCKMHKVFPDFSKKKLFDLHEIFKSLPGVGKKVSFDSSRVQPTDDSCESGIWELSDDILSNILMALSPLDLIRVASTCRHLRSLAVSVMPCMKLKLFPHQQAAVEWMLQREQSAEVLPHPLFKEFFTEDGFAFSINIVSGELVIEVAPTVKDFSGGMFCDEPGLGKTVTALSLILKTQGKLAEPPDGANLIWCNHNSDYKCGYYELKSDTTDGGIMILGRKAANQSTRRRESSVSDDSLKDFLVYSPLKRARLMVPDERYAGFSDSCVAKIIKTSQTSTDESFTRCTRSVNRIRKNLLHAYEEGAEHSVHNSGQDLYQGERTTIIKRHGSEENGPFISSESSQKRQRRTSRDCLKNNETWVQCDACHKWRRLAVENVTNINAAWFCSMNVDPLYQSCSVPEECWDTCLPITELPGFCPKGTSGMKEQNVAFFTNVLKDHYPLITSQTKKALSWLAKLSPEQLSQMETTGLRSPCVVSVMYADGFHEIFQLFGLVRKAEKGITRWYYPRNIQNLAFDVAALRIALSEPLNSVRLYLSAATLVVVPANLVDHWKTQIEKHIRLCQLRVCVLNNGRKISPHNLAWDYDVVITTFNRFSAEWAPRRKSALQQIHWLRIILDEGHTLGSSLSLTNKLQMAISLKASSRWILTGTPTPNTPNSELSHLKTMFKFLHEEAYGQSQKSWEAGILRPFEAEMEEGRTRLLDLLNRCMISARKKDLRAIPPCIKKVTLINFTEEHAKSYNELVVTVRRNILMADWNDHSHVESLLNPKQWKFRSTTIRNLRLSCCVAGHIKVADAGEDIQETMDIFSGQGLDSCHEEYALIKFNLLNGGCCLRCKEWCRLPVITPCRHLLCLDCVALDSERCVAPGCSYLYEMQTPESRQENPNPKWPVPKDLIELQPSYKQDDWNPDWQSTSSSKVSYLVQRLKELIGANKVISCEDEGALQMQSHTSGISDMSVSQFEDDCPRSMIENPQKMIIFSQFLEHIHVIEQQLTLAGIRFAGMYSPMHSSNKMKSLATFQNDATCTALLMDGSGALGLDLSFVNHVFLMEPIWDKSMEEQVISRAHRMGATRPIYVETLAMCGTIEQQMVELLQDVDSCRWFLKDGPGNPEHEGTRANRSLHDFAGSNYLSRLKCVRTNGH